MNRILKTLLSGAPGFLVAIVALSISVSAQNSSGLIEFAPDRWDLQNARVVDHLGRKALIGTAFLKGVELEDGVIECDIA